MKKACKRIKQKETTEETWVSGQFLSEEDMVDMGIKEARRNSIKAECATMKGWIRPGVGGLVVLVLYLDTRLRVRMSDFVLGYKTSYWDIRLRVGIQDLILG